MSIAPKITIPTIDMMIWERVHLRTMHRRHTDKKLHTTEPMGLLGCRCDEAKLGKVIHSQQRPMRGVSSGEDRTTERRTICHYRAPTHQLIHHIIRASERYFAGYSPIGCVRNCGYLGDNLLVLEQEVVHAVLDALAGRPPRPRILEGNRETSENASSSRHLKTPTPASYP